VLNKIKDKAKVVHIAGDDDQAIFRWAGADIAHFIGLKGKVTVLDHSYRLPREIHDYSKTILTSISNRRSKVFNSASHAGSVTYITEIDNLDFSKGSWLVLARSAYSLYPYISFANNSGLFYSYKERGINASAYCKLILTYKKLQLGIVANEKDVLALSQYITEEFDPLIPWYQALHKMPTEHLYKFKLLEDEGENLALQPRIQFSTIHGAKGAEADNVVICPDVSHKAYLEMQENPDDEARVFYVGVTRAKKNLYILTPQTRYFYEL
jgi:DNA helicase-2/ATP-dependent DNA helicase PcrA